MFEKKLTEKQGVEILGLIDGCMEVIDKVNDRLNRITRITEQNGMSASKIITFLLEKAGYEAFRSENELTEKDIKSFGKDFQIFTVGGEDYVIVKKGKVGKKSKKGKK